MENGKQDLSSLEFAEEILSIPRDRFTPVLMHTEISVSGETPEDRQKILHGRTSPCMTSAIEMN